MKRPDFVTFELDEDYDEFDHSIYNEDGDSNDLEEITKYIQTTLDDQKSERSVYVYQLIRIVKPQRVIYSSEVEDIIISKSESVAHVATKSEDKI